MNTFNEPTLHATFFSPVRAALGQAIHTRICHSLPDSEWLELCVRRTLQQEPSGLGFLQRLFDHDDRDLPSSTYFDSNATRRRLRLLHEIGAHVGGQLDDAVQEDVDNPLAAYRCLDAYEVFAGDGHYLAPATHDAPIQGKRYAVGHFFGLNLRTHRMFPMTVGEQGATRKREHDMRALKRLEINILRQDTPTGRRVIWVWDRAGIDASQWQRWKQGHGIYFISRTKENMKLEVLGALEFDEQDSINRGVQSFNLVNVGSQALRCVKYRDPVTGKTFQFLSSLTSLPPGVIAALYKARWDIEKVFDETKSKLGEKKSWGSSDAVRQIQAEAIALTHNLLLILERRLAIAHGLRPKDDANRRKNRLAKATQEANKRGSQLSPIVASLWLRATQRGLRFIRWLRNCLDRRAKLEPALAKLRAAWGL